MALEIGANSRWLETGSFADSNRCELTLSEKAVDASSRDPEETCDLADREKSL
jgi:hypothetical protein